MSEILYVDIGEELNNKLDELASVLKTNKKELANLALDNLLQMDINELLNMLNKYKVQ